MKTKTDSRIRLLVLNWVFACLTAGLCIFVLTVTVCGAVKEKAPRRLLVSWLMDRNVISSNEREIGEVDDLVIQREGHVEQVIIELDGLLELDGKRVAVSVEELNIRGNALETEASKTEMDHRPAFSYKGEGFSTGYFFRIRRNPKIPCVPYIHPPSPFFRTQGYPPCGNVMRNPAIWTYSQEKFPASILLGRRIYNYDSRPLGSLEDLLIKDGVVTALIISRDAGIRDRHIAAPYQPLDFGTDGILYDIAVEKLGSLPDYPYEAIKEDKPQDGPFGPFYTPPGVVETEEEIMVGQ